MPKSAAAPSTNVQLIVASAGPRLTKNARKPSVPALSSSPVIEQLTNAFDAPSLAMPVGRLRNAPSYDGSDPLQTPVALDSAVRPTSSAWAVPDTQAIPTTAAATIILDFIFKLPLDGSISVQSQAVDDARSCCIAKNGQ